MELGGKIAVGIVGTGGGAGGIYGGVEYMRQKEESRKKAEEEAKASAPATRENAGSGNANTQTQPAAVTSPAQGASTNGSTGDGARSS